MLSTLCVVADSDDDKFATAVTASFSVQARAEPGVMPRVMELFAKRGLVPQLWHGTVNGQGLTIEIRIATIDCDAVDYLARCMRQIVGVDTVLTTID